MVLLVKIDNHDGLDVRHVLGSLGGPLLLGNIQLIEIGPHLLFFQSDLITQFVFKFLYFHFRFPCLAVKPCWVTMSSDIFLEVMLKIMSLWPWN